MLQQQQLLKDSGFEKIVRDGWDEMVNRNYYSRAKIDTQITINGSVSSH